MPHGAQGDASVSDTRGAELAAAIDADPDDDSSYEIYADHLQLLGDPRGELIALSMAVSRGRSEQGAAARQAELERALLPAIDGWSPQVTWHHGFVRTARLPSRDAAALLAHPSLRFARQLELPRIADMNPLIAAIARAPGRLAVRELELGVEGLDQQAVQLDLAPLWSAAPNLARLAICGIDVTFGHGEVPLAQLSLNVNSHYGGRSLGALARARWPKLERFELAFTERYEHRLENNRAAGIALVEMLRGALPALRHLAVRGGILDDREPAALAMFDLPALLAQLETLDLSDNLLHDGAARQIAHKLAASATLHVLDVSRNRLSEAGITALAHLAPTFRAEGPHRLLTREEMW
jgi:uncharacterized protein (TIGR02996 family)